MLKALNPSVQRFSSVLHLSEQEIVVAVKKHVTPHLKQILFVSY